MDSRQVYLTKVGKSTKNAPLKIYKNPPLYRMKQLWNIHLRYIMLCAVQLS